MDGRDSSREFVRGPRITAEAAERLRELVYQHRIDPCEVVSRLLLGEPLDAASGRPKAMRSKLIDLGMSLAERNAYERLTGSI